jgi:hypothetical protein
MDNLHTLNGKPIDATAGAAAAPAPFVAELVNTTTTAAIPQVKIHRAECGNAGIVGEVGDLGTNAK